MTTITVSGIRTICSNPDSLFRYFGWPSVTRLPDGGLAMVASGFRLGHICPFGKGIICYSRDEGESWTLPAVLFDTPLDDRDCGIAELGGGKVLVTSFNNSVQAQRNWNGRPGDPRSPALRALSESYLAAVEEAGGAEEKYLGSTCRLSRDGGVTFGPVFRVPVSSPHGPCATKDGSVLYVGRYHSSDDSHEPGRATIACYRLSSENPEEEAPEKLGSVPVISPDLLMCEPHAAELPDGRLLVHIRVQGTHEGRSFFTVYQSESADGGHSFSAPVPLLPEQGGSPPHLLLHSSGILISSYGHRQPPYGVRVMLSRNLGRTWETGLPLYGDGRSADLGYPCTVELRDHSLLTVYYENLGRESVIRAIHWKLG